MTDDKRNLRLPVNLGIGAQQKSEIAVRWATFEQVMETVHQLGLSDLVLPEYPVPSVDTQVLTAPDSLQYTELHTKLLSWWQPMAEMTAQIKAGVLQLENMLEEVEAATREALREESKLLPKQERYTAECLKDKVILNPEVTRVKRELQVVLQRKMLFEARLESLERALKLVSRQIELRKLDFEGSRVNSNMPGRGRLPTFNGSGG